jgi:hypothetical protein
VDPSISARKDPLMFEMYEDGLLGRTIDQSSFVHTMSTSYANAQSASSFIDLCTPLVMLYSAVGAESRAVNINDTSRVSSTDLESDVDMDVDALGIQERFQSS